MGWITLGTFVVALLTFLVSPALRDITLWSRTRVSWRLLSSCVRSDKILHVVDAFEPDIIIAVNDGAVPGSMIVRNIDRQDHSVTLCYWRIDDDMNVDTHGTVPDLTEKKVLLIDDQLLRGNTMEAADVHARSMRGGGTAIIKRMTLFAEDTASRPENLDYGPVRRFSGHQLRMMPWSFLPRHQERYRRVK